MKPRSCPINSQAVEVSQDQHLPLILWNPVQHLTHGLLHLPACKGIHLRFRSRVWYSALQGKRVPFLICQRSIQGKAVFKRVPSIALCSLCCCRRKGRPEPQIIPGEELPRLFVPPLQCLQEGKKSLLLQVLHCLSASAIRGPEPLIGPVVGISLYLFPQLEK